MDQKYIVLLFSFLIMTGCNSKTVNTNSDASFFTIEYNVSIIEETESDAAQESSSELSATVAQGSETVSEVNSKPAATQNQETDSENSVSVLKSSDGSVSKEPSVGM